MNKVFTIPNILTFLRIMFTPIFVFLYLMGDKYLFSSILIFTIAAVTDYCDGFLARYLKLKSKLGAFLDPLADKFLVTAAFFAFYYLKIIDLWMVFVILGRDLLVTFLRIYLINKGAEVNTSYLAKVKTFMQFIAIYFVFIYNYIYYRSDNILLIDITKNIVNIFMYFVVFLTIWSAVDYLIQNRVGIFGYDKKL